MPSLQLHGYHAFSVLSDSLELAEFSVGLLKKIKVRDSVESTVFQLVLVHISVSGLTRAGDRPSHIWHTASLSVASDCCVVARVELRM